jgi:ribosome-associated toxin RatA of RatAB toxin-antitoxin module
MTKFDKAIVIAAGARDVFDHVSRPEHFPEFLPITGLTFLTNMRRGVGTRVRYSRTVDNKPVPAECGLSKLKLDEMVEFSASNGLMRVWRFTIKELEGGTELRWEGEYDLPSGFMDKVRGQRARVERAIAAELDESLQRIKEALESR